MSNKRTRIHKIQEIPIPNKIIPCNWFEGLLKRIRLEDC